MKPLSTPVPPQAVEEVWRKRAVRLARRSPASQLDSDAFIMIVAIAGERYGIELPDVLEVLAPRAVTLVPGVPPALAGVINVHGEIRPVVDFQRILGNTTAGREGRVNIVLLRHRGQVLGLQVDSFENVQLISAAELPGAGQSFQDLPLRYLKLSTQGNLRVFRTASLFSEVFEGVTPCN